MNIPESEKKISESHSQEPLFEVQIIQNMSSSESKEKGNSTGTKRMRNSEHQPSREILLGVYEELQQEALKHVANVFGSSFDKFQVINFLDFVYVTAYFSYYLLEKERIEMSNISIQPEFFSEFIEELTRTKEAINNLQEAEKIQKLLFSARSISENTELQSKLYSSVRSVVSEYYRKKRPTFGFPAHSTIFTVLALFSGKFLTIPNEVLQKNPSERTQTEQHEVDSYLNSIFHEKTIDFDEYGMPKTALVARLDRLKLYADAELQLFTSPELNVMNKDTLAVSITRSFGAEGMRHLLGFVIALDRNSRQGIFTWNVEQHLELLGYERHSNGSFRKEDKQRAYDILQILTNAYITAFRKDKNNEKFIFKRLFAIVGGDVERDTTKNKYDLNLMVQAVGDWYTGGFTGLQGQSPQYTKILTKLAQEHHYNHSFTIFLSTLLPVFWRINPQRSLSVSKILEWCNVSTKTEKWRREVERLERELDYMVEQDYIGSWEMADGSGKRPSETEQPLLCILRLHPPEWLKNELLSLQQSVNSLPTIAPISTSDSDSVTTHRRTSNVNSSTNSTIRVKDKKSKKIQVLSVEQFTFIMENCSLTQEHFALELGISRQLVSYIRSGKRQLSSKVAEKVIEKFPSLYQKSLQLK